MEKKIKPIYPNSHFKSFCYIKSVITRPNIIVGDYSYYDDMNEGPESFEKLASYEKKLIILAKYRGYFRYVTQSIKEDKAAKEAQIKMLQSSIERREKLLSNENYVNKAPKNIVDMDRIKLEEEKRKLEELLK